MPIEREFKFVMSMNLTENDINFGIEPITFHQYYLNNGGRIRYEIKNNIVDKIKFNYKEFISPEIGQVEIECDISEDDAELLKSVSISKLEKVRHFYVDGNGLKWEIDFFKNQNQTYFILMEVEVETGEFDLNKLPDIIKNNIQHIVNSDDNSFTSKKLESMEYAKLKMKEIKKGIK